MKNYLEYESKTKNRRLRNFFSILQTMLEDKIKATDWEATNEAIEEQVARESYLQWLRDNEMRKAVSILRI